MAQRFNPLTGAIEDDEQTVAEQQAPQMPGGLTYFEERAWEQGQIAERNKQAYENAEGPKRDLFAQDPGQFFDELGNIAGNAVIGMGTDILDLGAGLGDIAVQTASWASGNGFDLNQVFNDSDNPWTQARRDEFAYTTEAGKFIGDLTRLGTMFVALPKAGVKGLTLIPKIAAAAKVPGAAKAVNKLGKLDDALQASTLPKSVENALDVTAKSFKKTRAGRAASRAGRNDWLYNSFKEVADEGVKSWGGSVQQTVKGLTAGLKTKPKIKTISDALVWDLFATFNVYGEGDFEFDETLIDTIDGYGFNVGPLGALRTNVTDSGLVLKAKQMAEGLLMGQVVNGMLDMARVYRFSRNFSKATASQRDDIIKALNAQADEIGASITSIIPRESAMVPYDSSLAGAQRLDALFKAKVSDEIGNRLGLEQFAIAKTALDDLKARDAAKAATQEQQAALRGNLQALDQTAQDAAAEGDLALRARDEFNEAYGASQRQAQARAELEAGFSQGLKNAPVERLTDPDMIKEALDIDIQEMDLIESDPVVVFATGLLDMIGKLLPQKRTAQIEQLKEFPPIANGTGTIPAVQSVMINQVLRRSREEGFGGVDPFNFDIVLNRRAASELDQADISAKQAQAWDEFYAVENFDSKPQDLGADAVDDAVQPAQLDDPAAENAARNEAVASAEMALNEAAEAKRLSAPEEAALNGEVDGPTALAEMDNLTPKQIRESVQVQEALDGSGYEVVIDGEVVATAKREGTAKKLANQEADKLVEQRQAAALQKYADGQDEVFSAAMEPPILESSVVGTVGITGRQAQALMKVDPNLTKIFEQGQNLKTKKNYTMSLTEMQRIQAAVIQGVTDGTLDPKDLTVLRNALNNFEQSMKLLDKPARELQQAEQLGTQTNRYLSHGDYC